MKKLLYICRTNLRGTEEPGVAKKIHAQIDALRRMGYSVDSIHTNEINVFFSSQSGVQAFNAFRLINNRKRTAGSALRYLRRGWNGAINFKKLYSLIDFSKYDIIYFRYYFANKDQVNFFTYLKRLNPEVKIILELPAYPYATELTNLRGGFIHKAIDAYWRKKFSSSVDIIVTFSEHATIFGIPTISITNGIDPSSFKVKSDSPVDYEFRIIGVGNISPWHGYDRLINGMVDYKKTNSDKLKIRFYVVGTGQGLEDLKNLVSNTGMQEDVLFLGQKSKNELQELYETMHLGVGSLGLFRNNLTLSSSLKHREYTAVGLPFILATKDPDFTKETFFVKYVPDSETTIDISEIIEFYNNLKQQNGISLSASIHQFAEDRLSWLSRMQAIITKALST